MTERLVVKVKILDAKGKALEELIDTVNPLIIRAYAVKSLYSSDVKVLVLS